MSRYLEEAAEQLRKAAHDNDTSEFRTSSNRIDGRERIARGFATLAAIDEGLLPAEIVQDVLRAITDRAA